ncbi:hypothetical protein DFJ74DRAFT_760946 [Hyaloraphidium curvatum]|nr:hypothetical protein DFJ74DRAFT_760946 [Hyaloraphidium curvatum]
MKLANRSILLVSNPPEGTMPSMERDFKLSTSELDTDAPGLLGDGDILLETLYISVDAYMRNRMRKGTWLPGVQYGAFRLNDPVEGYGVSRVLKSRNAKYPAGSVVSSIMTAWSDYQILRKDQIDAMEVYRMIVGCPDDGKGGDGNVPLSYYVGPLGSPGLTAFVGLFHNFDPPRSGETLFVSGAAGAVGQCVVVLCKMLVPGLRVVGSAGTDEKCAYLRDNLGIDAVFNYKKRATPEALAELCPDGIDFMFDNVGGATLEAAILRANKGARISLCGRISSVNLPQSAVPPLSPAAHEVLKKNGIRMGSFGVRDKRAQVIDEFWRRTGGGKVFLGKFKEDGRKGLENAVAYWAGMVSGDNFGKAFLEVKDPKIGSSVISKL